MLPHQHFNTSGVVWNGAPLEITGLRMVILADKNRTRAEVTFNGVRGSSVATAKQLCRDVERCSVPATAITFDRFAQVVPCWRGSVDLQLSSEVPQGSYQPRGRTDVTPLTNHEGKLPAGRFF